MKEFFERMKKELKVRGRTVGTLYRPDTGQVCLLGAALAADGFDLNKSHDLGHEHLEKCLSDEMAVLRSVVPEGYEYDYDDDKVLTPIWRFNDHADINTTKEAADEAVLALLDKAIEAVPA